MQPRDYQQEAVDVTWSFLCRQSGHPTRLLNSTRPKNNIFSFLRKVWWSMSIEDFTELMEQNIKVHELADVQIKRLQSEVNDLKRRVRELEERNEN